LLVISRPATDRFIYTADRHTVVRYVDYMPNVLRRRLEQSFVHDRVADLCCNFLGPGHAHRISIAGRWFQGLIHCAHHAMNIHEYQAKELLQKFGVATTTGKVESHPDEAEAC